jgi:hypothetical protein
MTQTDRGFVNLDRLMHTHAPNIVVHARIYYGSARR